MGVGEYGGLGVGELGSWGVWGMGFFEEVNLISSSEIAWGFFFLSRFGSRNYSDLVAALLEYF